MLRLAGATASMLTIVHARLAPNLPPGSPDISPSWTPTWDASESSYLYWCNWSGPVYTPMVSNWSIVSLDWSDWKWGPLGWAAAQPMDNEERLYADAINIVANSRRGRPKAWVYRNSCKALPWYSSVRAKLESPAHRSWFLSYGPPSINGSYYSPPCDPYSGKCSTLYHDSTQSPDYTRMPACPITGDCSVQVPGYPSGDGNCSAPACDVGSIPVGEYVFDPRAWNTSVNGQTLGEWWLEEYLFSNTAGGNPNITGVRCNACSSLHLAFHQAAGENYRALFPALPRNLKRPTLTTPPPISTRSFILTTQSTTKDSAASLTHTRLLIWG